MCGILPGMPKATDEPLQGLRPSLFRVQLVTFMPFVAIDDSASQNAEETTTTRPGSVQPAGMWRRVETMPRQPGSINEDLRLWDYSDSLIVDLVQHLPHREWQLELDPADAPLPQFVRALGRWEAERCNVEVWNTGIGNLTTVYTLAASQGCSWSDVRDSVAGVDAKRELLIQGDGAVKKALGAGFSAGAGSHPRLAVAGRRESGIQWVQHLVIAQALDAVDAHSLSLVADAATGGGVHLRCGVDKGQAAARLGIEACVATNPQTTDLSDSLTRVIATQTTVWAAAIDLDQKLLGELKQATTRGVRLPLSDLEGRAMASMQVFERVQRFRASVSTIGAHLGTLDKNVWQAVNEEWRLSEQLDSLDAKMDAVEHVHRYLIDTLTTRQGRTLNQVVLLITLLSLASFLPAMWDFTHKTFDALSWLSLAVVGISMTASLALFGYVKRRTRIATVGSRMVGIVKGR